MLGLTPDGAVVRIGSSKTRVGGRLRSYATDINKRLLRDVGPTPRAEAEGWLARLAEHGAITAVVHQPPMMATIAGSLRPYLDIERVLLEEHCPPFNRRGVKRLQAGIDPLSET